MKTFFKKVYPIIVSISLPIIIYNYSDTIQETRIVEDDFLLNFIGIFLGLAIAIITFLFTYIDTLRRTILESCKIHEEQKNRIINNILVIYKEMKDDTIFLFYLFLFCFALIIFREVNLPFVNWPSNLIVTKTDTIIIFKLFIGLLSLFSLNDIIITLFKLIQAGQQIDKN